MVNNNKQDQIVSGKNYLSLFFELTSIRNTPIGASFCKLFILEKNQYKYLNYFHRILVWFF